MAIVVGHKFGSRLIEILHLPKNTNDLVLHVPVDGVVEVQCSYFPDMTDADVDEFESILSEYYLVEKEKGEDEDGEE